MHKDCQLLILYDVFAFFVKKFAVFAVEKSIFRTLLKKWHGPLIEFL